MPVYTDKKTNRLYIEFQYKGHRYKERLPDGTSKTDAAKLEVKIKNDLMFQFHGVPTASTALTFDQFIDRFFGPVADQWRLTNPARYERTVLLVKDIRPMFKGKVMRSIKAADIERVKQSRINLLTMHGTPRKPATVEREMSIISSIFKMAVDNDVIEYNPCSRVKKLAFDNIQDRLLRREDDEKFFAHLPTVWTRDVCRMVLNTGLRQNDLMRLTPFQVDLDNALITLIQGKTKRRVLVPLNDTALEILRRRWSKNLLFASPKTGTEKGSVRHSMVRACIKAGIPVITIRDLRRTFATRGLEDGADFATIADILGHTGLRMLPRYVRSLEMKRKMVNSIKKSPHIPPVAENDNVKVLKRQG